MSGWYRWDAGDLVLNLRVQPRANRDEICDPLGERLKVRLTAPPVEGKANVQLIRFLAKEFAVSTRQVQLEAGAGSRNKRVRISNPARLPSMIQEPRRGTSL